MNNFCGQIKLPLQGADLLSVSLYPRRCRWAELIRAFSPLSQFFILENTETQISLDFGIRCNYFSRDTYFELHKKTEEIGRMLNHMIQNPEKYSPKHK